VINGLESELNKARDLAAKIPELENHLAIQDAELRKLVQ